MDLKEIGINTRNWDDLAQEKGLESPCECSVESPGSISYGGYFCELLHIPFIIHMNYSTFLN